MAVPGRHVLRHALDKIPSKKKGVPARHKFVMAQRFIDDQYLINKRPFYVRLWATLSGGNPVTRAYLFSGGIIVFGNEQEPKSVSQENVKNIVSQEKERAQGLIVNLFQQNRSATLDPWSIADIRAYLHTTTGSDAAFNSMWDVLEKSTAAVLAAAVPSVRQAISKSRLKRYQGGNIEVLGLDFVLDSKMRPWLVEVNYLPSMARKVINCVLPTIEAEASSEMEEKKEGITPPPEICKDNPMDLEKESFLAAYLRVLAARQASVAAHVADAAAAVEQRAKQQDKGSCSVTADLLRQVLDAEVEWQAAVDHGFSDLTPRVYASFECMAGKSDACTSALPSPPEEVCQEPTRTEGLHAMAEWGMAQVRRAILGVETVWQRLVARPKRPVVQPRYVAITADKLVGAWLQLPRDERQGDVSSVMDRLCTLEASLTDR